MIPDIIKLIPKLWQQDLKAINLANKIDTSVDGWKTDTLGLKRFTRPDECPSWAVEELNEYLNAGAQASEADSIRRKKVAVAIASHKYRGTWVYDLKNRIEAITAQTAVLFYDTYNPAYLMRGSTADETNDYMASMGIDCVDYNLGIWMMGDMEEFAIPGNIYIDLGAGISAATLLLVVDEIERDNFAYYYIYLGYST